MRVALYARVSRDDLNLENQVEPLKKWAVAAGEYDVAVNSVALVKAYSAVVEVIDWILEKEAVVKQ